MTIKEVQIDGLPNNEMVFDVDGQHIRVKINRVSKNDAIANAVSKEMVSVKVCCGPCSAAGDLAHDDDGVPMWYSDCVHSVMVGALISKQISFDAWLAEIVHKSVTKAAEKAYVMNQITARFKLA